MPISAAGSWIPAGKQGRSIGESSPEGVSLLLSFTVAWLRLDLPAVIAPSTWQRGGLERQRLQQLLAKGTIDERSAMAWLVNQVNRFGLSVPNTRSPISGCTRPPMPPEP